MTEWNKEQEKKILYKYRFTLTVRVMKVIIAVLFLFWVYMMVVTISFNALHLDKKHAYYSQLATDWTNPNVREDFGGLINSEITPFLTQEITYPVARKVGKEYKFVGEMRIKKALFNTFSNRNIQTPLNDNYENFQFSLPNHPKTGEKIVVKDYDNVWTTLEKVHEGTVAELAFSTTELMTAAELLRLLEPYDLYVVWAPLYTGEFKEFEPRGYSEGGGLSIDGILGLTGGRAISDDYMSEERQGYLTGGQLNESKKMMLTNMERLLENESRSYYENFLGLYALEKRYQYLKNNGFMVYGAVVTGPVKELLKLKNVKEIQGARLGEMSYWNWE